MNSRKEIEMKTLEELRKALAEVAKGIADLKTKAFAANATEDDTNALAAKLKEAEEIEKQIKLREQVEEFEKAQAKDANDPAIGLEPTAPARPKSDMRQTEKMGLIAMASVKAEFERRAGETVSPMKVLEDVGYAQFAKQVDDHKRRKRAVFEHMKALNASVNVSGGFLTPDNQASDIIELLYPATTFLQGGPRTVRMPGGTFRQPAGASGASASYRQEGGRINTSQPSFREISLSAKFLGCMVMVTEEMLDFSLPGARAFIEGDMREAMAQVMDQKAYYGSGAEGEPTGILTHAGISTVVSQDEATPTLIQIDTDMDNLELALLNNNIPAGNWRYVMAPRTKKFIGSRRVGDAGNGEFAFPEIRGANPTWGEYPVLSSTNFPINGGAGGDESDVALVNFSDVILGLMDDIAMAASSEATVYHNGALVSTFQNNLVALRAISGHDIGLRRVQSVAKLVDGSGNGITWGA